MIHERAKKIKMLIVDVDGVFTDGKINMYVEQDGTVNEMKSFYAPDGLGFVFLRDAGITGAIITGRSHKSTEERAKMLGIKYLYQGFMEKLGPLNEILRQENITLEEVAYIGDDLIDLPILSRAGLACCPANSHKEVKEMCHLVTQCNGGEGAIREVIEVILQAQGLLDKIIKDITNGTWTKKPKAALKIITSDGNH